jgi:hypothetical protein
MVKTKRDDMQNPQSYRKTYATRFPPCPEFQDDAIGEDETLKESKSMELARNNQNA